MTNLLTEIQYLEATLIELIHQRFGLIIHVHQAQNLIKTIAPLCHKYECSPLEFLDQLKKCDNPSPLWSELVSAITVGESYFFRDKNQMNLLARDLLPRLIKQNESHLKIWSAGCSSGEEIYTIAMLLAEILPNIDIWDLYLLGTDINTSALEKAKTGIYSPWSMRSIPEKYRQRYFVKNHRHHVLSSEIRNLVQFKYLNLCDNSYPSIILGISKIDLILCRNVLIYFDNELISKIMKKLSACMDENAYLLLGASDPIVTRGTSLFFHHTNAIYFSHQPSNEKDFE